MYLKRVDLENFKSFRKAAIPILPGFTGVTGPNGSGKSNISDAVLFVLGTHSSKAIRAGRLVELIHNGGKKGKSAHECSVSLVFDNTDRTMPLEADEVTLTRVIRRSPSDKTAAISKYLVNAKPSTLQEFEDLLAHARISADGYNIVQQGDVTNIVNMATVERRRILDEVAGITRFDEDVEKAERQEAEVDAKLEQVRIILREIAGQLKSLDREKGRAAEYRGLRDTLELTKAKLARKRLQGLQSEIKNIHESIASYESEGGELRKKGAEQEKDLGRVSTELARLGDQLAELGGDEARDREEKIQGLREEIAKARQMMNHLKDEVAALNETRGEVDGTLGKAKNAQKETGKELDEVAKARTKWAAELADVERELEGLRDVIGKSSSSAHDLQQELARLRADFEKAHGELHTATLELERLTERRDRIAQQGAESEEQAETARFEHKDLAWELKECQKARTVATKNRDLRRQDLFKATKARAEAAGALKELEPKVRALQNEYSRLKAEKDAAEHVQGMFSRPVEAILAARDQGKIRGIVGTIAELGRPRKGYETAAEVAAGGLLQAVVVDNDAVAASCIDHLKKNELGRATFLPLNKMVPGRPGGQALMKVKEPGAVGFALDLVRHDEKYKAAFWYVYRDTIVVEDLASARKMMGGARLVTAAGEVIDQSGAMSGGSLSKNRLTFGAAPAGELEELAAKLREAVQRSEGLAGELQAASELLAQAEEALREVEREATTLEAREGELARQVAEAESRLQKGADAAKDLAKEREGVEKEIARLQARAEPLKAAVEKLEATKEEKGKLLLKSTQKSLADKLESLRTQSDEIKDTLRDFETQAKTLEERFRLGDTRLREMETERDALDEKVQGFKDQIAGYQEKAKKLGEELGVLEQVEAQQSGQIKDLSKARDAAMKAKYELENEIRRTRDALDANADLIVQFKGRVPTIEAAIAESQAELAAMTVQPPADVKESQDELRGEVRDIERRMGQLEPVNMRALEEFEELQARKDTLEAELEQLEERRQGLVELVDEIMGKKKEGLMKVFTEIAGNFSQVYSELSAGGSAELVFENEADPFQGGLVLKAQPVGKRVRRLEALSGGEKSLAALSFIFAVQRYAPSPFYVLDEVDMFLDGVNSELVARMVERLSTHAQFIIVSLRKVTLKEADHVYGVTIAEGVSQIIGQVDVDEIVEAEPPPPQAAGPVAAAPPTTDGGSDGVQ